MRYHPVWCGCWFQSGGWLVHSKALVKPWASACPLHVPFKMLWERENGSISHFSFPLNEWSLVEIFVFKKNWCSRRRSNFFIRKTKLDLKLLILVSGWTAGKKQNTTGWNFDSSFGKLLTLFFEKKMWNCVISPSTNFHSSICESAVASTPAHSHCPCYRLP